MTFDASLRLPALVFGLLRLKGVQLALWEEPAIWELPGPMSSAFQFGISHLCPTFFM